MTLALAEAPPTVEFDLTPIQHEIFSSDARFRVVVAGRRSGKTHLSWTELLIHAAEKPGAVCWYITTNHEDARDLAWKPLMNAIPSELIAWKNESYLEIRLVNGSEIRLMSAEKKLRGRGLEFVVLDEFSFLPESVWTERIRPSLSDTGGRALFITTPCGYNWAYELYMRGLAGEHGWQSWQFTTADAGIVPLHELEAARRDLDPRIYRQEYEASFETLKGRVYSNFDRIENVDSSVEDTGGDLLVGQDFNVNPMASVIAVRAGDECHVLDAIELPVSNTEEVARELRARYPDRNIIVCPDPSGRARKTSAPVGQTDFTILEKAGFSVRADRKAPPVVDRINNTQAMLLNSEGRRRVRIHPRAHPLIKGLDGLTYKEGTSRPDKSLGLDHICDAFDYLLWERFNVLVEPPRITGGHFEVV